MFLSQSSIFVDTPRRAFLTPFDINVISRNKQAKLCSLQMSGHTQTDCIFPDTANESLAKVPNGGLLFLFRLAVSGGAIRTEENFPTIIRFTAE